jgi:hypothetical protein
LPAFAVEGHTDVSFFTGLKGFPGILSYRASTGGGNVGDYQRAFTYITHLKGIGDYFSLDHLAKVMLILIKTYHRLPIEGSRRVSSSCRVIQYFRTQGAIP